MKYELSNDDVGFIKSSIDNYVLTLDGNGINQSDLPLTDKIRILSECYYIVSILMSGGSK